MLVHFKPFNNSGSTLQPNVPYKGQKLCLESKGLYGSESKGL